VDEKYRHYFSSYSFPFQYANPGDIRQLSVFNGLEKMDGVDIVLTHDSARPFVRRKDIFALIEDAATYGAATLATPVKPTIKETLPSSLIVKETPSRANLYEIQTPQALKYSLFIEGFQNLAKTKKQVTDDASLVELLQKEVKLTMGS